MLEITVMVAGLGLFLAWWGHWLGNQSASILTITTAQHVMTMPGAAAASEVAVRLPDIWPNQEQVPGVVAHYQISLPSTYDTAEWAINVGPHVPGLMVTIDGFPASFQKFPGNVNQVALIAIGQPSSGQKIDLTVPQFFGVQSGLGPVRVGPMHLLERQALIVSLMHTTSNLLTSGVALGASLVIVLAFFLRRNALLMFLGYVFIAAFVRQGQFGIFGMWQGDDAAFATHLFSNVNLIVALSLLIVRATQQKWEDLMLMALVCLPLLGLVLYNQVGPLEVRRTVNFVFLTVFFAIAVARTWSTMLQKRQWILLFIVLTVAIRIPFVGYAVFDHDGRYDFSIFIDPVVLAPAMMVGLSLVLARHVQEALRNYELINQTLREELDTYKTGLAASAAREQALAVRKAEESERIHWLQEIHDGMGSQLIAARFLVEKIPEQPKLESVKTSIDDAIEQLRMLVESLSPASNTMPNLLGALRYRMVTRFEAADIALRWHVNPTIDAAELTSKQALNVQRIVQEALTNVLKHAKATTVLIEISTQADWMVVRVEDDGIGLQDADITRGHGMINMQNRARECDGYIRWTRLIKGTQIELRIPNHKPDEVAINHE